MFNLVHVETAGKAKKCSVEASLLRTSVRVLALWLFANGKRHNPALVLDRSVASTDQAQVPHTSPSFSTRIYQPFGYGGIPLMPNGGRPNPPLCASPGFGL